MTALREKEFEVIPGEVPEDTAILQQNGVGKFSLLLL